MNRELVSISKFLSLVLRHRPEAIGIELDAHGWANIDQLLAAAARHGRRLNREMLLRVVRENDKQRFALSADGLRIRANQGHSIDVDLELVAQTPPAVLYHGTVQRFLASIQKQGLIPGNRQYVHLSGDAQTARAVGRRRGTPVVLVIDAGKMAAAGRQFFRAKNGVWLTDHVPPQYLRAL